MFWFLLIAMVVVVAAVTLAVVGGGGDDGGVLPDAEPERLADPLPEHRPVARDDLEALRIPVALRGYRMADVDDVLSRLGAELAERDARIADLQAALSGSRAAASADPAGSSAVAGHEQDRPGLTTGGPSPAAHEPDTARPTDEEPQP
ncbi:cell division protein DivIVA [Streptomyces sp. NPDC056682]|uniref:cell division protein DivIVA n=1 Tax=Streptomyces sp. NPDC056682 TaxID=3345909 RepID=UPI00369FF867